MDNKVNTDKSAVEEIIDKQKVQEESIASEVEDALETVADQIDKTVEEEATSAEKETVQEEVAEEKNDDKQLKELKDKYLRLHAEFDNYRKRTLKERLELMKTASRDTMAVLLPVLDDFDRAAKNAKDNGEEGLPGGLQIVVDKLFKTLEQKGLKSMASNGESFDPELHEAITEIPAPTEEMKGKIVDTIEKGYYLNDVIIRHARVVVGK